MSTDQIVLDFDAGWAERKQKTQEADPPKVVLFGVDYLLPRTVPAAVMLNFDRMMLRLAELERAADVPDDFVVDETMTPEGMLISIVGPEMAEQWIALPGMEYPDILDAVRQLVEMYRTGQAPTDKETSTVPNRKDRRKKAPARS